MTAPLPNAGEKEYVRLEGAGAPEYRWLSPPTNPQPAPKGGAVGGAKGGMDVAAAGPGEKKKRVRKSRAKVQPKAEALAARAEGTA